MAIKIHSTAIVSDKAKISDNVIIDAYAIINDDVEIGEYTHIKAASYIDNGARIGKGCIIGPNAVVSAPPQDLSYKNEATLSFIGDETVLREFSTVHRGTHENGKTTVGSQCLIMAYSHIAHDCKVGNGVILSNATQIGGHVSVDDYAILGGVVKVHQFSNIGGYCMIGADARVVKDVPPFTLVSGKEPVKIEGINKVGLKRRNFSNETIKKLEDFYRVLIFSGLNTTDGINKYIELNANSLISEVEYCINFIKLSKRGIYR